MAITVTGITPTASTTGGGVVVTATGTGLDTVRNVLVNNVEATILSGASPTSLRFRTPVQSTTGSFLVRFLDSTTGDVAAGTNITYTVASTPEVILPASPGIMRLDVNDLVNGGTLTTPLWVPVRALTDFKAADNSNTADNSDYSGGLYLATNVVSLQWTLTGSVRRGPGQVTGNLDRGQEIIRLARRGGTVDCRWYDTTGGPEAGRGTGVPTWTDNGGPKNTNRTATFTINGQGAPVDITNPAIADPTLINY